MNNMLKTLFTAVASLIPFDVASADIPVIPKPGHYQSGPEADMWFWGIVLIVSVIFVGSLIVINQIKKSNAKDSQ